MKTIKRHLPVLLATALLTACSDEWLTDVVPSDKVDEKKAIQTVKEAQYALSGVLSNMQSKSYYGAAYLVYGDIKAMDVRSVRNDSRYHGTYFYTEFTHSASMHDFFSLLYRILNNINKDLVYTNALAPRTGSEKSAELEILGNLYALRALVHFDLLKVFARIPTAVDGSLGDELGVIDADRVIDIHEQLPRNNLQECYNFVIADLQKALQTMPKGAATEGRVSYNAIKALLARVYLYYGKYELAAQYAGEVIHSGQYSLIPYGDYKKAWAADTPNPEVIMQIVNTFEDNPALEGIGNLWSTTGYHAVTLTDSFKALLASDQNDERSDYTSISDTPKSKRFLKYPDELVNNIPVIRLSEMYFIAAECAYKQGDPATAVQMINEILKVRTNGKTQLTAGDMTLDRILLEKRKEFVGEGQTFFDYIRNKKDIERAGKDHLVTAPKSIEYTDYKMIQPIPRYELDANKNIQQNPEYEE